MICEIRNGLVNLHGGTEISDKLRGVNAIIHKHSKLIL